MSRIYNYIKGLCDAVHTSPTAMCKDVGISPYTMSALKSGKASTLTKATAQKIADYFHVSADDIMFGGPPEQSTVAKLSGYLALLEDKPYLTELLDAVSNKPQQKVQALTEFLKEWK